jgi:hypothetical protein
MLTDVNQEPLVFGTWRCACKKQKIGVKGLESRAHYFLYALVYRPCVRSELSPLRQSGTLIASWAQHADHHSAQKLSSPCTVPGIAL